MRGLTLSAGLLAASAYAQYTTVDLFMYDYQPSLLVASVVAVDATATTYSLDCPSSTSTSSCSYYDQDCDYYDSYYDDYCPSAAMVTAAPEFYAGSYDDTYYESSLSFSCDLKGTTSATCTCWNSYSDGSDSYTTTLDDYYITFSPVIVTAGGDLIGATGAVSVETILSTHTKSASVAAETGSGTGAAGASVTGTASRSVASTVSTPTGTAGRDVTSATSTSSGPAQATANAAASNLHLGASVAGAIAIVLAAVAL